MFRIEIVTDTAAEAAEQYQGFIKALLVGVSGVLKSGTVLGDDKLADVYRQAAADVGKAEPTERFVGMPAELGTGYQGATETVETPKEASSKAEAPKRERGKPSPGKARRTAAEIAEDEAADKADAAPTATATTVPMQSEPDEDDDDLPAFLKEPTGQAISTGEERIDPDAAQDEADEQADEPAAAETTIDDVRAAFSELSKAVGTARIQEVGASLLPVAKMSLLDPAVHDFAGIVAAVKARIAAESSTSFMD